MHGFPLRQGLYDPAFERDACGIAAVADLNGKATHELVEKSLSLLVGLRHRGATGADADSGDGAGILLQIPTALLREDMRARGIELPEANDFAVGMLMTPRDAYLKDKSLGLYQRTALSLNLTWLGSRPVPVSTAPLGAQAAATEPAFVQFFVGRPAGMTDLAFDRQLYCLRQLVELHLVQELGQTIADRYHLCSLSARTIIYKGMLQPEQLPWYFVDLRDGRLVSNLALVHSRFSTNTFPSWRLAHPFRFLAHNGEINTLRGNLTWLSARQSDLLNSIYGPGHQLGPITRPGQSDSASLDNALEMLLLAGIDMPRAMMMLMPPAYEAMSDVPEAQKTLFDFHATLMEPWDGPAAVVFSDGQRVGAALDRNGLRPCRLLLTKSGMAVLASEMGAFPVEADDILELGRLGPGEMIVLEPSTGRIIRNAELGNQTAAATCDLWREVDRPLRLHEVASQSPSSRPLHARPGAARPQLRAHLAAARISDEDINEILIPMALHGEEPISSMGDDTAIVPFAARPLFDHFFQRFAQVTNPPIDPLREELVMSLTTYLGKRGDIVSGSGSRLLTLKSPVLHPIDFEQLGALGDHGFKLVNLDLTFPVKRGADGFSTALEGLVQEAERAARSGATILLLTDFERGASRAALPSLLAVSAVHQRLVQIGLRTHTDVVVEAGDVRSVHDLACLIGYGARAVYPHQAFAIIDDLFGKGQLKGSKTRDGLFESYLKACHKGLRKILSKMGISCVASYCGAQIFESLGLEEAFVAQYFPSTPAPVGGLRLVDIAEASIAAHLLAFAEDEAPKIEGRLNYRAQGEAHGWNPETITHLQHATRFNDQLNYDQFASLANAEGDAQVLALRHMIELNPKSSPIALTEVEPASEIVRRFTTGAMSLGAISQESHEALAIAMNRLNAKSNTGEGGEDAQRFVAGEGGKNRNSAIKQVASARFGVTAHYLVNAREIQIKIAQGAKPGEGGQLPGHKVDAMIAKLRHATPGVQLISPPPHHDIYSIEDLAQLIFDLKQVHPEANVSVKLVASAGIGAVAAGVVKAGADKVVIAGGSGGTGASPLSSIRHAGIPWEIGLAEVQQTLVLNGLRERTVLEVDGQLRTGRDVVIAAMLGADEFGFATAPLIVQGCVMMRKCHLNICPVGIATQDPELRRRFQGQPEHVVNYFFFVAEEARKLMAALGIPRFADLLGQSKYLQQKPKTKLPGMPNLDRLLHQVSSTGFRGGRAKSQAPQSVELRMLGRCLPALAGTKAVQVTGNIYNTRRAAGTLLAGAIARAAGAEGLAEGMIHINLRGFAGQSLGAFLTRGINLVLEGAANDYVGKGLSGGTIAIKGFAAASDNKRRDVLAGNTCLYGATSGSLFVAGMAGERFAVRNSGALAVVEGLGAHGCEYMTGGTVVVLGLVGRNFAAGMSGGVAYIYDPRGQSGTLINREMITLDRISGKDLEEAQLLERALRRHLQLTGSAQAFRLLGHWAQEVSGFFRVQPKGLHMQKLAQGKARASEVIAHA